MRGVLSHWGPPRILVCHSGIHQFPPGWPSGLLLEVADCCIMQREPVLVVK